MNTLKGDLALDKDVFKEYLNIKAEIKDLEQRIKKCESEIVIDTVTGSSPEYPYTIHPISICGVANDDSLQNRYRKLVNKLKKEEGEIEKFIETLPQSRYRRILRYRVFDGMSWKEVAAKMGYRYSETTVRRIFNKVVENF